MNTQEQPPAEPKRTSLSIRSKLILGFAALSALVSFITATGMYNNLRSQIIGEFQNRALSVVKLAALHQNGDEFVQISSDQDDLYEKFRDQNLHIQAADPNIKFIFTMRKDNRGIYFVVNAGDAGEDTIAPFGGRYRNATDTLKDNFDTMTEAVVEPEISTDQSGSFLSAYAPIRTADGEQVGVIGVDILADTIIQKQRQIFFQSALVFIIALGLGTFFGYVAGNALTEPIVTLTKGAAAFASGKLDERIDLPSNDEIGALSNAFNAMADKIQESISGLEQRVTERTTELENRSQEMEETNQYVQRRASQFEALAQVAQSITSIRDLQKLLPRIATVVSENYGFYHVGLFLLDDANEYAVLIASNSEGGRKMIARKHRLKVGEQGIVGSVTGSGNPRIALDVGEDAIFFTNPELPDTHSEMALPLRSAGKVIGALDVQSTESGAFTNEDVQTLSLLADQVSLAIENARLFEDSIRTLNELQMVMRQSTREAWKRLPEQQKLFGYRYNAMGASPLREPIDLAETGKGKIRVKDAEADSFVVPIKLRDETIGSLVVQSPTGEAWNEDQRDLIKAVAERVALSAENARLFDETTQRAERERLVSEITGKIRSHNDPKAMIETAVNELRNALGASKVEVIPQSSGKESKV